MKNLFLLCFIHVGLLAGAQLPHKLFQEANQQYEDKEYANAIELYKKLADEYESTELYYNLGNAYYQTDSLAPAILYLEKAIKLDPTNEDAKFNLAICNQQTVDNIKSEDELIIKSWWNNFRSLLSPSGWAGLGIVCLVLAALCWIIYQRTYADSLLRFSFSTALLFSLTTVLLLLMASHANTVNQSNEAAIIFAANVNIKSSPSVEGKTLFVLHQGTKVTVRNRKEEWIEIMLPDGKVGWIKKHAIAFI